MTLKKILSAILALTLIFSYAALAEEPTSDARIAELEAQVADLTAQLEAAQAKILEYEQQGYIVTFDGGFVTLEEAQAQYDYFVSMYESYGYSVSGYEDYLREEIAKMLAEKAVVNAKAAELGLDQLDDETMATYEAEAMASYESNITAYASYFAEDGKTEEEVRAATIEYLDSTGYTYDSLLESMIETHGQNALYTSVTEGVSITEEDVQATYDAAVAEDEATYSANSAEYEITRANGGTVYWNPEGYRTVKHILIKFSDDQTARYTDLKALIDDLEAQIAAAAPAETEATETEAAETAEPVDVSALEEQLSGAKAELDALYQELMPKAEEAISRFEAGEAFDALMAEYGEDPGMQREPAMTEGYYVSNTQGAWEPAFTEGAMSIEAIGQISAPVCGSNGIHIICYLADVPAGAVDMESLRETLEANALSDKLAKTYSDQIAVWMEELHLEYHMDRFK